ncbi:MAG: nuclear transport factor 2 family protein [Pseudohongiellaceae bacterium]
MKNSPASSLRYLLKPTCAFLATLILIPAAAAQSHSSLSADDLAEIHNLYAFYNLELDSGNSRAWANTFTDDGSFNTSVGRQALIASADNWSASNPNTRHWNSNIHITPTADGAAGIAYLMLWNVGVPPAEVVLTGSYADELVKTPNGWRFKARRVQVDRPANP